MTMISRSRPRRVLHNACAKEREAPSGDALLTVQASPPGTVGCCRVLPCRGRLNRFTESTLLSFFPVISQLEIPKCSISWRVIVSIVRMVGGNAPASIESDLDQTARVHHATFVLGRSRTRPGALRDDGGGLRLQASMG